MASEQTTYTLGVGRRKAASARVKVTPAEKTSFIVNGRPVDEYFTTDDRRTIPADPIRMDEISGTYAIEAKVAGGGIRSQAEAIRMGVARALVKAETAFRTPLKKAGFLTRDARSVERKKPGLRKARKRPQWSKR